MPCSQEPVGSPQSKREQALWWVPSLPGANDNPLINEQTHRDLSIGATSLFPFCLEVVDVFYFHQKRSKLESLDSLVKHRFLCYVDEESPVCVCMCLSVCVEGIHRETGDPLMGRQSHRARPFPDEHLGWGRGASYGRKHLSTLPHSTPS